MATATAEEIQKKNALSDLSQRLLQRTHRPDQSARKKPKRKHLKNNPAVEDERFQETSYYFKDNLRCVHPYDFTFTSCVKKRWCDIPLLKFFTEEFPAQTEEYYKEAIANGGIKVNDEIATNEQLLKEKDEIKHTFRRHEPPVLKRDINFLCNDDDMVVIDKPPSLPVHPGGRYRHNSVVFLLGKEHNLNGLHAINRLDRLASGVLMFSKSVAKAKELTFQVHKSLSVRKEYLARVAGEFPVEEVVVNEPVKTVSRQVGLCQVQEDGDQCSTTFKRLSYNGKSSVVSCKLVSMRMHQIRVHLRWLGHPIVNDPIYNHPTAWGTEERKKEIEEVIAVLAKTKEDLSDGEVPLETDNSDDPSPKKRKTDDDSATATDENVDHGKEVSASDLQLYLHALSYKGADWEYETSTPDWAKEEWSID